MFNKFVNNYLTNLIKKIIDEQKLKQTDAVCEKFLLPEPDRAELLAHSIQRTPKDFVTAFTPPKTAMDSADAVMDSAVNQNCAKFQDKFAISGTVSDIIYTHFATQGFIGFQACAILSQNWLINKACSLPPKEAIATEYNLSYELNNEDEEMDEDFLAKLKKISDATDKFNIKNKCQEFAEKKRQFGQVLAFPVIEGVDYSKPFNIDMVTEGSYKGMSIVDPMWIRPELDGNAVSDPASLNFYEPTYFGMPNGERVHRSWVIFGINGKVPDVLKPTYFFGGYPIPQLIFERVYAAEKVANEAPMLAMSKRLLYMDGNLNTYALDQCKAENDAKAFSYFRDNWGVVVKRPDQNIGQIDTSLTDFDDMMMSQFQLVAAAAGMTAVKLLETQPKGFNSTGEYEEDQNRRLLMTIQKEDFVPLLQLHYRLLAKSKFDKKLHIIVTFDEIDTPDEKERAEINESKSRTLIGYQNAGAIDSQEVRDYLRKDPTSGFDYLDEEVPEGEEETNLFGSGFEEEGNGTTSQNPFSFDEWNESDHPRKDNGQFGNGGGNSGKVEKSQRSDKIRKRTRKEVQLPKEEYAQVMHELNSNLPKELKNKKVFRRSIGNHTYKVQNNGFNNYKIIGKYEINEMLD